MGGLKGCPKQRLASGVIDRAVLTLRRIGSFGTGWLSVFGKGAGQTKEYSECLYSFVGPQ